MSPDEADYFAQQADATHHTSVSSFVRSLVLGPAGTSLARMERAMFLLHQAEKAALAVTEAARTCHVVVPEVEQPEVERQESPGDELSWESPAAPTTYHVLDAEAYGSLESAALRAASYCQRASQLLSGPSHLPDVSAGDQPAEREGIEEGEGSAPAA